MIKVLVEVELSERYPGSRATALVQGPHRYMLVHERLSDHGGDVALARACAVREAVRLYRGQRREAKNRVWAEAWWAARSGT